MKKFYFILTIIFCNFFCTGNLTMSQTGCNLPLIRQTFTDAGCTELAGCLSSCSMYFYNPISQTGSAAEAWAQNYGANLISVQSAPENSCIISELNANGFGGTIWIGFNDEANEGNFVWYDQSSVIYTNWSGGEPNNSGNEDCTQIYPNGSWNDLPCTSSGSKSVIEVNLCPVTTITPSATTVCAGQSVNLPVSTYLGSSPYTYSWTSNIGGFVSTSSGPTVTPSATTTYSVTATDRYGCTSTASVEITVNQLPTATISGATAVCKNATAPSITFTGAVGTAPYTFTYSINGVSQPALTTSSGSSISTTAPTSSTGVFLYTLISVQDASSTACSQAQSGSITITVDSIPTATITGTTAVCKDGTAPNITFTGAGGTPPYTFTYSLNSGTNQTIVTTSGSTVNVSAATNTAGVYTYSLVSVHDASASACSQTQSGSAIITVNPLPTATITGTTDVCKDATAPNVTFTGAGGTAPYTFTFTVNGVTQPTVTSIGNSVPVAVPTFVAGSFTYSLVSVMDASSTTCSQAQSGSVTIAVNPIPTATISGTTALCKNSAEQNITFTGAMGTAPYTFTYKINGGTNQTVITTSGNSVNILAPTGIVGTLVYDLVSVQDASITACSQLQSGSATITVNPLPLADFDFADVCLTQSVNFNNTSTVSSGTNDSWSWDFGDSSPLENSQNPVYEYANAGTYNVTLIVTTNNGCTDTITKSAVVHPNPDAQFSTANVCDGTPVLFNDFSNIPVTDIIQSWTWNFGDGSPLNTNQLVSGGHPYANAGTYTVLLLVVSNFGCSDSISKIVIVNPNPSVSFIVNDTAGCELLCLSFQDASSIITGTNINWTWDVGEENLISNTQTVDHCYSNASVFFPVLFNVTLTVTSDSGCVSILAKNNYIIVYPNPNASFSALPETTTIINPVISISDASSGVNFWNWDFGDLSTSADPVPSSHTYADTGSYTITLITSTQYGCLDTAYQNIIIEPDFSIYIPNSFSPNGDDVNDTFLPKSIFIIKFEMKIFDRWGNLIFRTDDINKGWDGKANHGTEIALQDVYIYSINVTDIKRKKYSYKGILTLLR